MQIAVKDTYGTDGVGVRRFIRAGDPITPGLADVPEDDVRDTAPGDPVGPTGTTPAPAGPDYQGMSPEDLHALVDERGLEVEGTGKDGNVTKGDLVKALKAADAA